MSDMERLLRDELREQASRPQPDAQALIKRVRAARRRGTLLAAGLAVLLLTTGAALWLNRPGGPSPAPASHLPPSASLGQEPHVWFHDAQRGFALAGVCDKDPCATWLASTSDGGQSWTGYEVPGLVPAKSGPRARLRVLGPTTVVLDDDNSDNRWYTSDSGATWSKRSRAPQGTVDEIPPGGQAEIETNAGANIGVIVLRPDGTSARLARPPAVPIIAGAVDVQIPEDGSAWVLGEDDDRCYLQLSRDRGRTWTEVHTPIARGFELQTRDGHTLYLVDRNTYRVWRSTDDGRDWEELTLPFARPDADVALVAVALPRGGLIVIDVLNRRAYQAAGLTFTEVPLDRAGMWLGARMLRGTGTKGFAPPFYHSADSVTWTELRL